MYRIVFSISAMLAVSTAADAASLTGSSPGFHYFYKQGADMAAHDAALVDCAVKTRALINGGSDMTDSLGMAAGASGGFAGGFLGALVGGIIDNNENRQGAAANTEGCMAIGGWRVIALTVEEGKGMEQPDDPATIHEKLRPFIESPAPLGPVLRGPFANELVAGDFKVDKAHDLDEVSISVRAVRDQTDAAVEAAGELKFPKPDLPKGVKAPKPAAAIKSVEVGAADPDKSYVMLRKLGGTIDLNMTAPSLSRLGADGTEVVYDGAVTRTTFDHKKTVKGVVGDSKYYDYVVELPPGMWKLASIANGAMAADFCFGAPVFELGQGDVVFLGEMPVAGGYPLNADSGVAKEILAANPALADKVRPAEWTNGYTSDCFGSYAYAYEIPGAPFVDMDAFAQSAASAGAPSEGESTSNAMLGEDTEDTTADTISSDEGAEQ